MTTLTTVSPRLLDVFFQEAYARLADMRAGLDALRRTDVSGTEPLWRGAHTIRGNAAMLDLGGLAELAAAIERFGKATPFAVAQTAEAWLADTIDEIETTIHGMNGNR